MVGCSSPVADDSESPASIGPRPRRVVKLGVAAPFTGEPGPAGLGIRNAVDLAVRQANDADKVQGWRLELMPVDTSRSDGGADAAERLISDAKVLAVVGGELSVAAGLEDVPADERFSARLAAAGLVELSTTASAVVAVPDPGVGFRMAADDAAQGRFAARLAVNRVGARRVTVLAEKSPRGEALTRAFVAAFSAGGRVVVATESLGPPPTGVRRLPVAILDRIRDAAPDAVFVAGEPAEASRLSPQLDQLGLTAEVIGIHPLAPSPRYAELTGPAGEGDLAVAPTMTVEDLTGTVSADAGARFAKDYRAGGYRDGPGPYGPLAYDAANVAIEALALLLTGREAQAPSAPLSGQVLSPRDRAAVGDLVAKTDRIGISSRIRFDANGKRLNPLLAGHRLVGSGFVLQDAEGVELIAPPAIPR